MRNRAEVRGAPTGPGPSLWTTVPLPRRGTPATQGVFSGCPPQALGPNVTVCCLLPAAVRRLQLGLQDAGHEASVCRGGVQLRHSWGLWLFCANSGPPLGGWLLEAGGQPELQLSGA